MPLIIARGHSPGVIANDVMTIEDQHILRRGLDGILAADRIVGVETRTCPHSAVREDPTLNLAVIEDMTKAHPDIDVIFIESGGDNLTLTFSPLLADVYVYVMDVAGGDKMPRKQGPGMIEADLLVINKADLAPHVGADLGVMERDANAYRSGPLVFTDSRHGSGLDEVADWVAEALRASGATATASA